MQWLVTVKAATMIQSAWQSFVRYTYFILPILSLYSGAYEATIIESYLLKNIRNTSELLSKRINNNNRAHCTSNVCFEVILRGLWIVD